MNTRENKWKLLFYLLLVIMFGMFIWHINSGVSVVTIASVKGAWNLRNVDFATNCVRLSGNVEYIPGKLLTSEEFAASDDIIQSAAPSYCEVLTSRVRLIVPEDGYYEIAGYTDDFGSRIFINGKWYMDIGRPAMAKQENIPDTKFLRITVESENGVIEIVQQTSNFVFRSNTNHINWTIGRGELLERWAAGFTISYIMNMGIYFALFLFHLLLFIVLPSYRANLWYALLCLIWALRAGITNVRTLSVLFPWLQWGMTLRVEYLTLLAAVALFFLSGNCIFPGALSKSLKAIAFSIQGVFAVFYTFFPDTLFMSQTMIAYEIITGCVAIFAFVRIVTRVRKPDRKQKIIIASLVLVITALLLGSLIFNGIRFVDIVVMESTIMVFMFFQMTATFLGTMEEVAAAREAERHLALENAALERLGRLKNDFLANITHEMRTPLTVISGYAQLSCWQLDAGEADEKTKQNLMTISTEARRLAQLASQLLSISASQDEAIGRTNLRLEDIAARVEGLCAPILAKNTNRMEVFTEDGCQPVHANLDMILQVFMNLLTNANRHTKGDVIKLIIKRKDSMATFTVQDNGEGISPESLPLVFERGISNVGSSGLGLPICKEVVESHGGEIEIDSTPGKGTRVMFTLPLAKEEASDE